MAPNVARHATPFSVGQLVGLSFAPDAAVLLQS
jgi:hypothetical protein